VNSKIIHHSIKKKKEEKGFPKRDLQMNLDQIRLNLHIISQKSTKLHILQKNLEYIYYHLSTIYILTKKFPTYLPIHVQHPWVTHFMAN